MKTHINQIFTVVSFFSLSLTTTLAISWGMNALMEDESVKVAECIENSNTMISVKTSDKLNNFKIKFNENNKTFISKINLKSNR